MSASRNTKVTSEGLLKLEGAPLNIENSSASNNWLKFLFFCLSLGGAVGTSACAATPNERNDHEPKITLMDGSSATSFANLLLKKFLSRDPSGLPVAPAGEKVGVKFTVDKSALRIRFENGVCVDVNSDTYALLDTSGYGLKDVSGSDEPHHYVSQYVGSQSDHDYVNFLINDDEQGRCLVEIYAHLDAIE